MRDEEAMNDIDRDIDRDIETARALAQLAWDRRDWPGWLMASCVLLAWRIARVTGWAR
jgi:hypothetical protein